MWTFLGTLLLGILSGLFEPVRKWFSDHKIAADAVEKERARVAEILAHTQEAEDRAEVHAPHGKPDLTQRLDDGTA